MPSKPIGELIERAEGWVLSNYCPAADLPADPYLVEMANRLNEGCVLVEALQVEIGGLREFVAANDAADKARDDFEDRDGSLEAIAAADKRLAEARTLLTQSGKDDDRG